MGRMISTDAKVTTRLGDRIFLARKWEHVDAQDLAARIGVARKTVASWEDCRTEPTFSQLRLIAEVLDVPRSWLEEGEGEGRPPLTKWLQTTGVAA